MKLKRLDFVLECISEDEMKTFETETIALREVKSYFDANHKLSKMFWFTEDGEDGEFWFSLIVGKHFNNYEVSIDVNAFYNGGWSSGFDEVFMAHRYKMIKPFIEFAQKKCREIEQVISNHEKTRVYSIYRPIKCKEYVSTYYKMMKNYYQNPLYDQKRKNRLNFLKTMKVL